MSANSGIYRWLSILAITLFFISITRAQDYDYYKEKVQSLYNAKKYSEGIAPAILMAEKAAREFGKKSEEYAIALSDIGVMYKSAWEQSKKSTTYPEEAEKYFELSIQAFRDNIKNEQNENYIYVRYYLAQLYEAQEKYNKGISLYLELLKPVADLWGIKANQYGLLTNNIAVLYGNLGKYDSAVYYSTIAAEQIIATGNTKDQNYNTYLINLAYYYELSGDIRSSVMWYEKLLDLIPEDDNKYYELCYKLFILYNSFDLEKAMQFLGVVRQERKISAPFIKLRYIQFLNGVINELFEAIDPEYTFLEDLCEEVIGTCDLKNKDCISYKANAFSGLGLAFRESGNYPQAEASFIQALGYSNQIIGIHGTYSTIKISNQLASLYTITSQYSKADSLYSWIDNHWGKIPDNLPEYLRLYSLIIGDKAFFYMNTGRYVVAEELLMKSIQVSQQLNDIINTIIGYIKITELYYLIGDLDAAEKMAAAGLAEIYKANYTNTSEYALILNALSQVYIERGHYPKALELLLQAETLLKQLFKKEHQIYGRILANIGLAYGHMRIYDMAFEYLTNAREIIAHSVGKLSEGYIGVITSLARIKMDYGDYKEAEAGFLEAVFLTESLLGKYHIRCAEIYGQVSVFYYYLGIPEKAWDYNAKHLEIVTKAIGKESKQYAYAIGNKALYATEFGLYEEAEQLMEETIALIEKMGGAYHPDLTTLLSNLSQVYTSSTNLNLKMAKELLARSIQISDSILGQGNTGLIIPLNNLASIYSDLGMSDSSIIISQQAMDIIQSNYIDISNIPEYLTLIGNLAAYYEDLRDYALADSLYKHEILLEKAQLSRNFSFLSELEREKNIKSFRASLKYYHSFTFNHHLRIPGTVLFNYDQIISSDALLLKSIQQLRQAISTLNDPVLTNSFKKWVEIKKQVSNAHSVTNFKTPNAAVQISPEASFVGIGIHFEVINDTLLITNVVAEGPAWKAGMLAGDRIISINGDHVAGRKVINEEYKSMLRGEKGTVVNMFILRGSHGPPFQLSIIRDIIQINAPSGITPGNYMDPIDRELVDRLENEAEAIEKQLLKALPELAQSINIKETGSKDIGRALGNGEAAIEFLSFGYNKGRRWTDSVMYVAFLIRQGDSVPLYIPLFEEGDLRGNETAGLLAGRGAVPLQTGASGKDYFSNWYRHIWEPLAPYLQGVHTIYYAPSGLLHKVSFDALKDPEGRFLIDRYALHRVISTGDIPAIKSRYHAQSVEDKSIALFGGANYDLEAETIAAEVNHIKQPLSSYQLTYRTLPDALSPGTNWHYLPGTLQEVKRISSIVTALDWKTELYINHTATEDHLKMLSGSNAPVILHIATHGYYYPEVQEDHERSRMITEGKNIFQLSKHPLMRSGILLSGANQKWKGQSEEDSPDIEDGIVTALDIANLDFNRTELVVLSACETGLGDVVSGEGVMGLQRAFRLAGAERMIVSLWQVPDKETAEMMALFYHHLAASSEGYYTAFRKAQEEMRLQHPNDPIKWAGFVLIGE